MAPGDMGGCPGISHQKKPMGHGQKNDGWGVPIIECLGAGGDYRPTTVVGWRSWRLAGWMNLQSLDNAASEAWLAINGWYPISRG